MIKNNNHMQKNYVDRQHVIWNFNTEDYIDRWYVIENIMEDYSNRYYVIDITAMQQ